MSDVINARGIQIRPLVSDDDFRALEALQTETWGANVREAVTAPLAKITQKLGGIAAGAFDRQGEMLGYLFGFTGLDEGTPVHWSHMLAVRSEARNRGIGRMLKLYQRETLLRMGIKKVLWSFDPLVAKNAQLNLNSLGAEVLEYVEDMYGSGDDSEMFRGIGTDRFVMVWLIAHEKVERALAQKHMIDLTPFDRSPLALFRQKEDESSSTPIQNLAIHARRVRVEIPSDVHQLMTTSLDVAVEWRAGTREVFHEYLKRNYHIEGFYRDQLTGRCFYCLERPQQE